MPGRPITDQQMRYYMTLRTRHTRATAAAMAGFSTSTGYRVERDPRLPSRKKAHHGVNGGGNMYRGGGAKMYHGLGGSLSA